MDATAQEPNAYAGIDVSKDQLDVHIRPAGEAFSVSRDAAGLEALIEKLKPFALKAVAMEATGGFESAVVASLAAVGLPVIVVNPLQVRKFAEALGKHAKTDTVDALVIARFAEATKPHPASAQRGNPGFGRSHGKAQADHPDDHCRAPARHADHQCKPA